MVLKKSKSSLNSGATQKCLYSGGYRRWFKSSELTLTITLLGLPTIYDETNPSTEHVKALEKIYDYLGIRGPGLPTFYESVVYRWNSTNKYLSYSLNKRELWDIPERIERLMKENNFGDGDGELALTRITKVTKILDVGKTYRKESCELNSEEKKDQSPDKGIKKRRIYGKKRRGVQRPHLLAVGREQTDQVTSPTQTQKKIVEIEVQDKDHIDARVLRCHDDYSHNFRRRIKQRHNSNAKGCVNGKGSYEYRIYNPAQLKKEISLVISNLNNEYDLGSCGDYYDDYDNENEIIEDYEEYCYSKKDQLCNYPLLVKENHLPPRRNKSKRKKRKEELQPNGDIKLVNVNRASSKTTVKHPKGSYQFIERPCDDLNTDIISLPESIDNVSYDLNKDVDKTICMDPLNESNSEKTQESILLNRFEIKDDFIAVNLELPKDFHDKMLYCLLQSKNYNIMSLPEYSVTLGNCYPPIFCIDLEQFDSTLMKGWSLIGTSSSEIHTYKILKWRVTLKNSRSSSIVDDNIKNDFFKSLRLMNGGILQFYHLIQKALDSFKALSHAVVNDTNLQYTKITKYPIKHSQLVSKRDNSNFKVCSVEEAANKLQNIQSEKKEKSALFSTSTSRVVDIKNDCIECDICFDFCYEYSQNDSGAIVLLPCNHTYCYECWKSHIFYQLMGGNADLVCMHTDCRLTLNETVVKSFIPEHYLVKLYRKRQEVCIETSPLCQWCPYTGCTQVAMIPTTNEHIQQFGMSVDCDCEKSWCFSCKSSPHWPVSCSQAEAYKNLLRKLGGEMPITNVTFNVDLKPCPGCKYPVEKSDGCPHMICRMCQFNFCWKCLRSTVNHRVWECNVDERSTFVTYQLHNEVINNFPLEFLRDAIDIRKRKKSLRKRLGYGWLNGLSSVDSRKIKRSFHRSVQSEEPEMVKLKAIQIAMDGSQFLCDCYGFLEYFYLVFSFALLNNERDKNSPLNMTTRHMTNMLTFIAFQLEDRVIGNSIRKLYTAEKTCQMYLENGRKLLEKLRKRVGVVQKISKDVAAEPIGRLDPKEYYRYM